MLLAGINDSDDEARKLAKRLRGMQAKVNLIPLNPAEGIVSERPSDDRINEFGRILSEHHVTVSVRKSRGDDIRAGCGQLAIEGVKKSPAQKLADAIWYGRAEKGRYGEAPRHLPGIGVGAHCRHAATEVRRM